MNWSVPGCLAAEAVRSARAPPSTSRTRGPGRPPPRPPRHSLHARRAELAADRGGAGQHAVAVLAQAVEPAADDLADALRNGDRELVELARVVERALRG